VLVPNDLASKLEQEWLGQFPGSSMESGDLFAGAVSAWFVGAQAAGIPCVTALPRRFQLAAAAGAALEAGVGPTSGALLAGAVASYYAGQVFGVGVAAFPVALPAGMALMTAALLDLNMPQSARASQIAQACHLLALSTIVTFPVAPPPPSPIT
jgi:hypothetical protein